MNLIRLAIERPIAVVAAVLIVIMFGMVGLAEIPIQLTPDVREPVITVSTTWPGASPVEIEREIVNRQEEVLKGLEGLASMVSSSQDSFGEVTLEFETGHDMGQALLLVANRLDRVTDYPEEADEPSLSTASAEDNAIAWFIVRHDPDAAAKPEVHTFGDFVEDVIQDRVERVQGVARTTLYGGSERELQIVVDPEKMARYGLTVPEVVARLREADASITAGDVDEGKRRYVVRTDGELNSPERVRAVVLRGAQGSDAERFGRVSVGDIAMVGFGYRDPSEYIRTDGLTSLAFSAVREAGANVIETMDGIRAAVDDMNAGVVPEAGLLLELVYDETVYIDSAIDLVLQNVYVGGVLAALILLLFLRSAGATAIISLAIPISVIGSFVAMAMLGRSINVISLAGIAFAVGMAVDAAIVVLENIYRLRQEGRTTREAAYHGAVGVWGAVFVSALTTVLVFVPILIMELEVGQLFRDIAVAISVAVLLSLVVSITVIPPLANRLLRGNLEEIRTRRRLPVIDGLAERYRYMQNCVVIGRGLNYGTAYEFALKLKELTYTLAEPYSSADFLHGPVSLIEQGFPVIVVAPAGALAPEMMAFVRQARALGAELLCVSDDERLLKMGRTQFPLPSTPEWLSPLLAIVPGQLFALFLAAAREYDPDRPRGLRKVTETH